MADQITLVALDPGTSFGIAWGRPGGAVMGKTLDLGKRHPGERIGLRYHRLVVFLTQLFKAHAPVEIAYEVTPHQKGRAAHLAGGWEAIITSWCELRGVEYRAVNAATIKSKVIGIAPNTARAQAKGRAMTVAKSIAGYEPRTQDEADAICLLGLMIGDLRQRDLLAVSEGKC